MQIFNLFIFCPDLSGFSAVNLFFIIAKTSYDFQLRLSRARYSRKLVFFCFVVLLFHCTVAKAMTNPRRMLSMPRIGAVGFQQDFNNYLWLYDLNISQRFGQRWQISGAERFRSSLLRVGSSNDKWKDDQTLNLTLQYQALPNLSLLTTGSFISFLDQQTGYQSDIRTIATAAGIEYAKEDIFQSKAMVGPKWDTRYGLHDSGRYYAIDVHANELDFEGYRNNLALSFNQDQYRIRKNYNYHANYAVARQFHAGTSDSLRIILGKQRRDNYLSSLGDIESFQENIKGFDNFLIYGITPGMRLRLDSRVLFKNVQVRHMNDSIEQRRRERNDQLFSNSLTSLLRVGPVHGYLRLLYENQQQKYRVSEEKVQTPFSKRTAFVTPDNENSTLALTSRLSTAFTFVDSLSGYFSISKFQYDTPDTNNFDDRDELRINTMLIAQRVLGPFLKLKILASVNLYHTVYIFGERSADNNWNRIFRLRTDMDYRPSTRLSFKQSFEVLANYIDYDFDQSGSTVKSFVFRKFAADDSLRFSFTKRMTGYVDYRLQLDEHGRLFWERWAEQVLMTRVSHWLRISLKYSVGPKTWVAPGYTLYRRDEWRHQTDPFGVISKQKARGFVSRGLTMQLLYQPSRRIRVRLSAIRLAIDTQPQSRYFVNNIDLQLFWYF